MDIIHLPLKNYVEFSLGSGTNKENFVMECTDIINDPAGSTNSSRIRGQDFAKHGVDCVRFCNTYGLLKIDADGGIEEKDAKPGENCIYAYCHQDITLLDDGSKPSMDNCPMLDCNLLSDLELEFIIKKGTENNYCNGNKIKCYEFTEEQLTYTYKKKTYISSYIASDKPMCQIHTCLPPLESAEQSPYCTDEISIIKGKGNDYVEAYELIINGGEKLDSMNVCETVQCDPIIHKALNCTGGDETNAPDIADAKCDCAGEDDCCTVEGYCIETIDCNADYNKSLPDCSPPPDNSDDEAYPIGGFQDPDSWLYRPLPHNKIPNLWFTNGHDLCYTLQDMKDNGWGRNFRIFGISLGWRSGLFSGFTSYPTEFCGGIIKSGIRGIGYTYMCQVNNLLWNEPGPGDLVDPRKAPTYIKGYAHVKYKPSSTEIEITACVRLKNSGRFSACGKRECSTDCLFSLCGFEWCGSDICKTLTINTENPFECTYTKTPNLFNDSNKDRGCAARIDGNIRLRAVDYSSASKNVRNAQDANADPNAQRRIGVFLDMKGTTAYSGNDDYFNGEEVLNDSYSYRANDSYAYEACVDGFRGVKQDNGGKCNGKNTNDSKSSATKWRTVFQIPYIGDKFGDDDKIDGYYDVKGNFFAAQKMPKYQLRIGPPRFYTVANVNNSLQLFEPILYVKQVTPIRGSQNVSLITDFHYPEMIVQYGDTEQLMSLGANNINGKSDIENYNISPSTMDLTTTRNYVTYTAHLFVKKEYQENIIPVFCLYREHYNSNNNIITKKVGCVDREAPYIYSSTSFTNYSTTKEAIRKAIVQGDGNYINLKLMFDQGTDQKEDTDDDNYSKIISLNDPDLTASNYDEIEAYRFYAGREECSALYIECIDNLIALHNAELNGENTSIYEPIKNRCDGELLGYCYNKWGIYNNSPNIFDVPLDELADLNELGKPNSTIPSTETYYDNAYGWWNEICITKGFDNESEEVIAYIVNDGAIKGKCIIFGNSPYLNDDDPDTHCDRGGHYPNCVCQDYDPDIDLPLPANQTHRPKTPREAGLCVDIPIPNTCAAIDYTITDNNDADDKYYTINSLNQTAYNNYDSNDSNTVHRSHLYRTQGGNQTPYNHSNMILRGHAEFPYTISGLERVGGKCNGFWTYQTNDRNEDVIPRASCQTDGSWSSIELNTKCVRYSCSQINTSDPIEVSLGGKLQLQYESPYGLGEEDNEIGFSNGYALWPSFTKTNDFPESVTASTCITGFQPSGGNLPTRNCNQLGNWETPATVCERLTCDAITIPDTALLSIDIEAYSQAWEDMGGATFSPANASRSLHFVENDSIIEGECQSSYGFYQITNTPPERDCMTAIDKSGNAIAKWGSVRNPCANSCKKVTDTNQTHGWAFWLEASDVLPGQVPPIVDYDQSHGDNGCETNYITSPYSPPSSPAGISLTDSVDLKTPTRECAYVATSIGAQSVWGEVQNPCTNVCPGYNKDPRENVGQTTHSTSQGNIIIQWDDQEWDNSGGWQYKYQCSLGNEGLFNAGLFTPNRTDGCYFIKRRCGNGSGGTTKGVWEKPTPLCLGNNGEIANSYARYSSPNSTTSFILDSTGVGEITTVTGSCVAGYQYSNLTNSAPERSCIYKDNNNNIDEVWLSLIINSYDCKEMTCQLMTNQAIGNSIYSGQSKELAIGESEYNNLSCKNDNYGKALVSGSRIVGNEESYICQLSSGMTTNRTSVAPHILCGDNAELKVADDCEECRDCTINQTKRALNAEGCNRGRTYTLGSFTLPHNKYMKFSATDYCPKSNCIVWDYAAKCLDGDSEIHDVEHDRGHTASCIYKIWIFSEGNWGDWIAMSDRNYYRKRASSANGYQDYTIDVVPD